MMMGEPTNASELEGFLLMVNQLGKFILQLAERDIPLRELLSKKRGVGCPAGNSFSESEGCTEKPTCVSHVCS